MTITITPHVGANFPVVRIHCSCGWETFCAHTHKDQKTAEHLKECHDVQSTQAEVRAPLQHFNFNNNDYYIDGAGNYYIHADDGHFYYRGCFPNEHLS